MSMSQEVVRVRRLVLRTHTLGDDFGIPRPEDCFLTESTNALLGLLGQDMALKRLGTHDLAGAGTAKTLCATLASSS